MPINVTLTLENEQYNILRCHYGFYRAVSTKGCPKGGMGGGCFSLELESGKNTSLLKYATPKEAIPVSGRLEFFDRDEMTTMRTIEWEKAYIYAAEEALCCNSSQPMTLRLSISPLRMDIDGKIRLDRRFPQTSGFWWEEYRQEELHEIYTVAESEKEPEIIKACWKDAKGEVEIKEIPMDGKVSLYAETRNISEDMELTFKVPLPSGEECVLKGCVDKYGVVLIKDVKF